jgi:multimeric flavodoxin WrbA
METTKRKILVLQSSPRKKGNCAALVKQAAAAASAEGAQVETISLQGLQIKPFTDCDQCKTTIGRYCSIEDDMQSIYPRLLEADALLIASPIYWFTYNAQLKLCIDRWYGLWKNRDNFLRNKPVGIILTYGDTDEVISGAINAIHTFKSMFAYLGAPIAAVVHGSVSDPGDAEKNPDLMQAAYDLGKQLARN